MLSYTQQECSGLTCHGDSVCFASPWAQVSLTTSNRSSLVPFSSKFPRRSCRREGRGSGATCALSTTSIETAQATSLTPVLILPGLGNASSDYDQLTDKLLARGHGSVEVVPIQRWQWGLNAKGFFMPDYWRGTLKPASVLDWYFDRVDRAVERLAEGNESCNVHFLGHSAGGWLARAYIAERLPKGLTVSTLLTLGTPNQSPPGGSIDQTRGLLSYIEANCDVSQAVSNFVCVAGRGTVGRPLGKGSVAQYVAYLSYAAVSGRGDVDGDGVTPVNAACAANAELILCDDCEHSMLTSDSWYGSDKAFDSWVSHLQ